LRWSALSCSTLFSHAHQSTSHIALLVSIAQDIGWMIHFPFVGEKSLNKKRKKVKRGETPAQQRPNNGSDKNTNQTTQRKRKKIQNIKIKYINRHAH
jgi:hypothetical protein